MEIVPWLTQPFGKKGSARLILEEEVDQELVLVDFLASLNSKYPAFGEVILDFKAHQLYDHVSIVFNDVMLPSEMALSEPIKQGDTIVFLPAFVGG